MAKVRAHSLVIDASVAAAAGDREADQSRLPTAALVAARDAGHRVVVSALLLEEWQRHQTRFARAWLLSMYARHLVEKLDVAEDQPLRGRIEDAAPEASVAAILLKDTHLIEVAMASEGRVLSLDDRARCHFHQAAKVVRELRAICWVNPVNVGEQAVEWLRAGAPVERHRKLGYVAPKE